MNMIQSFTRSLPGTVPDRAQQIRRIKALLKKEDAVLVAHYYTDADLQALAEETGGYVSDSLDMARFGHDHPATTLVVAGVRFMGETAKILNPEKRVLMPTLEATCSLDESCPAEDFIPFCDSHADRTVVVYANTSAAVKARADWVVTSSIAMQVVRHLSARGEKVLWAPDRHLGDYIHRETGADMLIWKGACVVHEEFRLEALLDLKRRHPHADVLAHPESPAPVLAHADMIGSTSALIEAARTRPAKSFIVATDHGILYKMRQAAPDKEFLEAPTGGQGATCKSCAHCPWMAMNSLAALESALRHGCPEITIPEAVGIAARKSVERMLTFAAEQRKPVLGLGNA